MDQRENKKDLLSIGPKTTLLDAIRRMDELDRKLLIVLREHQFAGLISIGDVQRAILKGHELSTPVEKVLRDCFTLARELDSREDIRSRMLANRTEFMPVLNEAEELVDVIFWEDILPEVPATSTRVLDLPVVIMAGGEGVRLRPLTSVIPKALVPLGEKAILAVIMEKFRDAGCRDFHISVNYKAEMIEFYLKQEEVEGCHCHFFREDVPLGTAGSLALLRDVLTSSFFVNNCDILIDQDYGEIYDYHKNHGSLMTMVAAIKTYRIPYGTLEMGQDGELIGLREKPEFSYFVNSGMYLLEPRVLELIADGEFLHITDLADRIREQGGRVGVFPVSEGAWTDIGEWPEYKDALSKRGYRGW